MTRSPNTIAKQTQEYMALVDRQTVEMLIIRLVPGMEMLAQELSTGQRMFEQDWVDPTNHPSPSPTSPDFRPYENEGNNPIVQPPSPFVCSPNGPEAGVFGSPIGSPTQTFECSPHFEATQRRRTQHWTVDGMGAYPTLVIEASKVQFYETGQDLNQGLKNRSAEDVGKILINMAHVVSIEKIIAQQVFAQNMAIPQVAAGDNWNIPAFVPEPFTITSPTTIPVLTAPTDEMMFQVRVRGGQAPYRFSMLGQPSDLYITHDGWVRGFIEDDVWPVSGYREFMIRVVVQDSSIPRQHAVLDFRYRLFPAV